MLELHSIAPNLGVHGLLYGAPYYIIQKEKEKNDWKNNHTMNLIITCFKKL